ncbi:MAG: antibiotic biosynthesis monooxygenase [Gammaproteobacteria bacterium]|nr:antibiotic biosynthesis monooxygenase [Gammaproteobacteria bacterium]
MIIISATLDFASEADRDRAVELTTPIQAATRDEEPGCQAYCFAPDPVVKNRIQVYELWDDGPTLAAHFKHANYEAMKVALQKVGITGTENQMYLIDAHEPVYSANGEPRETFFDGRA